MYKIKRFSAWNTWKAHLSKIGTVGGAAIGGKLTKGSGKGMLIGAGVGLAGGLYLGHRLDKAEARAEERRENERQAKVARDDRCRYPTKDLEKEYPAIVELGGMPKEYYQAVDISKKLYNSRKHPNWGDGDEYLSFYTCRLDDVDDCINGESWVDNVNEYPLICLGYQDECNLSYNFSKHQWFDVSYENPKRVTNLKSYILKIIEAGLKDWMDPAWINDLGEDNVKEVIEWHETMIKIIKSSKLG